MGREKKRAASSARTTTGKISAPRQPIPDAADKPTSSGAEIAQALAVTFDSVRATALHSPCLSESTAPAAMPNAPPQRETRIPQRTEILSPKKPSRTAPRAKALKCRLAAV